jgi:hypothetical protein
MLRLPARGYYRSDGRAAALQVTEDVRGTTAEAPFGSASSPALRGYFHALIDLLDRPNPFRKNYLMPSLGIPN